MIDNLDYTVVVMIVGCLIAGIIVLGGLAGVGVKRIGDLNERLDDYDRAFSEFFATPGTDQMSPFSQVVDQVANVIADRQALITQASIRGALGGTQRVINQGLEEVALQENPGMAMADILPKTLKKNPMALLGLQALMSKLGSGGSGSSGGNHTSQAKFKL